MTPPTLEALLADAIYHVTSTYQKEKAAQACLRTLAEHGYRIVGAESKDWVSYGPDADGDFIVRSVDHKHLIRCGSEATADILLAALTVPPVEAGEVEAVARAIQYAAETLSCEAVMDSHTTEGKVLRAKMKGVAADLFKIDIAALSASRASEPPAVADEPTLLRAVREAFAQDAEKEGRAGFRSARCFRAGLLDKSPEIVLGMIGARAARAVRDGGARNAALEEAANWIRTQMTRVGPLNAKGTAAAMLAELKSPPKEQQDG